MSQFLVLNLIIFLSSNMLISLQLPPSELSKLANTGDGSSKQNNSFDFVLPSHVQKGERHENNKFSDIEQLVKGKKFTRYVN
jgi:hypothetical protein